MTTASSALSDSRSAPNLAGVNAKLPSKRAMHALKLSATTMEAAAMQRAKCHLPSPRRALSTQAGKVEVLAITFATSARAECRLQRMAKNVECR
jgi:hypothetical protein